MEKDRERQRASTREGSETVLNNAVDYSESRARQRRSNNTEQYGEAKLTRAVETWRNTLQIDSEDYRTSKVEIRASSSVLCNRAKRSHDDQMNKIREIKRVCVFTEIIKQQIQRKKWLIP